MNLTVKYTIVSLAATSADFSVFKLLEYAHFSYEAFATFVGMLIGAIVSWSLHRYWVFTQSTESEKHKKSSYFFGQLLCVALNVALMGIVADALGFPRMASRIFTSVAVWLVLYWFNRRVVFKV
jgi:putative flippase GtrA